MKITNHSQDHDAEVSQQPAEEQSHFLGMLQHSATAAAVNPFAGVAIGELLALHGEDRTPLVSSPGQVDTVPVTARSVIALVDADIGKQVVLTFERADPTKPIIIGVLQDGRSATGMATSSALDIKIDGERVVIDARDQIVLRCGEASITLTRAGKVLIQGQYVSSRSAGVNRVKGGSVQIN